MNKFEQLQDRVARAQRCFQESATELHKLEDEIASLKEEVKLADKRFGNHLSYYQELSYELDRMTRSEFKTGQQCEGCKTGGGYVCVHCGISRCWQCVKRSDCSCREEQEALDA